MKKKLIGIIICMLLIAISIYPVTGVVDTKIEKQRSGGSQNFEGSNC